jgi:choline dehydrogenase-like flavoprotein
VAADSIRVTRAIVAQPALARYRPEEYLPGPGIGDDEAALEKAAGDIGTTIFHPVGTARMGRDDDPRAVVDARLRVIGLDGLRVADASVMPSIPTSHPAATVIAIAERAAALIAGERLEAAWNASERAVSP